MIFPMAGPLMAVKFGGLCWDIIHRITEKVKVIIRIPLIRTGPCCFSVSLDSTLTVSRDPERP